ncbi:flagellar basal body rod protein FlgB [soil metagenome]
MTLDDIPLFNMLKAKLGYDARRQGLIAQNVANSETPGFAPKDLRAFSFEAAMQSGTAMTRTQGGHIAGRTRGSSASAARPVDAPDGEARLDGNQVVLEEQMMKMSDARADYDAAISMYQQSMSMLRTAARRPGG